MGAVCPLPLCGCPILPARRGPKHPTRKPALRKCEWIGIPKHVLTSHVPKRAKPRKCQSASSGTQVSHKQNLVQKGCTRNHVQDQEGGSPQLFVAGIVPYQPSSTRIGFDCGSGGLRRRLRTNRSASIRGPGFDCGSSQVPLAAEAPSFVTWKRPRSITILPLWDHAGGSLKRVTGRARDG